MTPDRTPDIVPTKAPAAQQSSIVCRVCRRVFVGDPRAESCCPRCDAAMHDMLTAGRYAVRN
jgi:uncharacterized paraquat-inducible protein A